ncbi:hypothetical protein EDB83DRAFT_2552100 [Lactarius deliciosus]|nr:hypothetical protein EDB83DRAFT_2552100 [Lactarius deliciosus]
MSLMSPSCTPPPAVCKNTQSGYICRANSSNRPASARMRQLRGSMERRWWIAVWRDCAYDGVGIVALPMGRIIARVTQYFMIHIVDEIIPAYHFEDRPSTSYDVTSGQFTVTVPTVARPVCYDIMRIQWLLYLGYVRAAREKKPQLKITWIIDLGSKTDPMLREAPATDTNPSTQSRGGRAAYAAFAMAVRDLSRGGVDWTIAVQNRNLSEWSWLPLLGIVQQARDDTRKYKCRKDTDPSGFPTIGPLRIFCPSVSMATTPMARAELWAVNNPHHVQVQAVADFDGLGIFFWDFFLGTHHLGWRLIAAAGWFLGRRKASESALQSPSALMNE